MAGERDLVVTGPLLDGDQPVTREAARGILAYDGLLIMLRRVRPGVEEYVVAPGGGVEEIDSSLENAVRREVFEEIGGTIDVDRLVLVLDRLDEQSHERKRQWFFLARLLSYDLALRCGPEFADSSRGEYLVERIPLDAGVLAATNIKPVRLKKFLIEHSDDLFDCPDLRGVVPR